MSYPSSRQRLRPLCRHLSGAPHHLKVQDYVLLDLHTLGRFLSVTLALYEAPEL